MKKKGISPLIATVLLIGFTVVLAAGIMLWWVGTTKDFIDKEGASKAAQARCAGSTAVEVMSCENGKEVVIKNVGVETVTAVIVRDPDGGADPVTEEIDIDAGEEEDVRIRKLGEVERVQVLPAILEDGVLVTCTNQLVESMCLREVK